MYNIDYIIVVLIYKSYCPYTGYSPPTNTDNEKKQSMVLISIIAILAFIIVILLLPYAHRLYANMKGYYKKRRVSAKT